MDASSGKVVDGLSERAYYLVPCHGVREDGTPCRAHLFISLIDKTVCPQCDAVYPNWPSYLASRTLTK